MSPHPAAAFGPGAAQEPADAAEAAPRTALPIREGRPRHLEAHLARLQAGAEALGWSTPWLAAAGRELVHWLEACAGSESALRLELQPDLQRLDARLEPLPQAPSPCRLVPMPHPMGDLRHHPLAPHKGLSGPWRPGVLAEARRCGAEDGLLLWPDGTLAETAIATVALEWEGRLVLPPSEGRVASVAERLDLPAWAAARDLFLCREAIPLAACAGRPLWCLNALRGLWPATLL